MSGNQNAYTNLWRKYCDLPLQKVSVQMGASLLKTAGLNETTLRNIWELSDYLKTGSLDQKGFFLALHLVALAQSGKAATLHNISPQTPTPRFTDLSDNMQPSEWEEAEKKFNDLPHQDGFLSGNSVKPMMLASGLPPQILARIWQMVDTDADGKLRVNEFCVALFLISQCSGELCCCCCCCCLLLLLFMLVYSWTAATPEHPLLSLHQTLYPQYRIPRGRQTTGRVYIVRFLQEEVPRHFLPVQQG